MSKTHSALKLAQKAFYDKDPEAIALLQLDEQEPADDIIYLEEN